jgi:acyl-CoA thioester hydrolase
MHTIDFRIYYEDTDCGGVVYHSKYLNFTERARTEMLRSVGINQGNLLQENKIAFVVAEINSKFIKPAKLDDLITVNTKIIDISRATILMEQEIFCNDVLLFSSTVKIACVIVIADTFKPSRVPEFITTALSIYV